MIGVRVMGARPAGFRVFRGACGVADAADAAVLSVPPERFTHDVLRTRMGVRLSAGQPPGPARVAFESRMPS